MDSNDYPQQYSNYDCVLAVDFTSTKQIQNAFESLKQYQQTKKIGFWLFII
jgi:para-aminobenzoate synthetase component 1